jgi:hypothetical protein
MAPNGLPNDVDALLAELERLPLDALEIVRTFVTEMIEQPDDNERRKEALNSAIARLSALRSV